MPEQVTAVTEFMSLNYEHEMAGLLEIDKRRHYFYLTQDAFAQHASPSSCLLMAKIIDGAIVGVLWVSRNEYATYSNTEMASIRFIHILPTLSARQKITLVREALMLSALWSAMCNIKVLVSSTITNTQQAFLKIHDRMGFILRGSICYLDIVKWANEVMPKGEDDDSTK